MPEVLLIDDDPLQLRLRGTVLREAGFAVTSASSADAALKLLQDVSFSEKLRLIVTDHVMPGVSGTAFIRELRNLSRSVPVIVVSGSADAQEEYSGLHVTFLQKPCPPEELIRRARTAVTQKS